MSITEILAEALDTKVAAREKVYIEMGMEPKQCRTLAEFDRVVNKLVVLGIVAAPLACGVITLLGK